MGNAIEPITTPNQPKTEFDKTQACFLSLLGKIGIGDIATQCKQLLAADNLAENKAQLTSIKVQSRAVQEARKQRLDLLKQQFEASKKSGFWDKVSKIVAGVFAAVATVVSCIPGAQAAGAIIAAVGAAIAGGFSLASAYYNRQATDAATQVLNNNLQKDTAAGRQDDGLQALQNLAQMEKSMAERIRSIQESEHRASSASILKPAIAK